MAILDRDGSGTGTLYDTKKIYHCQDASAASRSDRQSIIAEHVLSVV